MVYYRLLQVDAEVAAKTTTEKKRALASLQKGFAQSEAQRTAMAEQLVALTSQNEQAAKQASARFRLTIVHLPGQGVERSLVATRLFNRGKRSRQCVEGDPAGMEEEGRPLKGGPFC